MARIAGRLGLVLWTTSFFLAPLLAASGARAVLINFENVPGTTALIYNSPSVVPVASRLTTQLQLSDGVSFSSTPGYAALVFLGSGHATSGVNGIGGVASSGLLDYRELWITFTLPGSPSTPAVTDSVSIHGDLHPIAGTATLEAYDVNALLLGSVTVSDTAGGPLSFSQPGIHSLRITTSSGTIAFDDLAFGSLAIVPEPATAVLVGVGLVLLGSRRSRE